MFIGGVPGHTTALGQSALVFNPLQQASSADAGGDTKCVSASTQTDLLPRLEKSEEFYHQVESLIRERQPGNRIADAVLR